MLWCLSLCEKIRWYEAENEDLEVEVDEKGQFVNASLQFVVGISLMLALISSMHTFGNGAYSNAFHTNCQRTTFLYGQKS